MPSSEASILHDCLVFLGSLPHILVLRANSTGMRTGTGRVVRSFNVRGVSDIIGVIGPTGRWLSVECKSATGKLSEHQELFRDAVLKRNGIWILARSVDDLRHGLQALGGSCY